MSRYTTDEALSFIESMRLTIGDRVGFRWMAAKLDRLAEHVAWMAEENARLRERLEHAGSDAGDERLEHAGVDADDERTPDA